MSNAGRGKSNQPRIPRMNAPGNGLHPHIEVPDDLVWDEDNPPIIYPCSQHTEHHPFECPGPDKCPPIQLDSESQVMLLNEGRAWSRAGMNWHGIPMNFPGNGIPVEIVDLLIYIEVMKPMLLQLTDTTEFELEEAFREKKLKMLTTIRGRHEDRVRKQRVANTLGIVEKPPLLGPDGRPI